MNAAELKTLFLFEALTDEQREWLARQGSVRDFPAGSTVFAEGDPAESFFVLLSGTLALSRRIERDDVETTRTDQRGVYMGGTRAYFREEAESGRYLASMRAITDCSFFVLPAADFGTMVREWFPMAMHLIEGLFYGMRSTQAAIGQRERLAALGSLAAGLMHELNNPATATVRATAALRQRVAAMRHKLGLLASERIDPAELQRLATLQEAVIERAAKAAKLTAMQASDAEDELGDWLDGHGVTGGWDLAPVFVQAGLRVEGLAEIAGSLAPGLLDQAVHWLAYALETEQLMTDIEDASARISSLVGAARQYSQLDRAAHQWVDVHDGIDSTLVMLGHKLGDGIRVVTEYDRELPRIPARPAELNQVWTNLVDNAADAMDGHGTLTIRTGRDGERVLVEVCDTGPGVPEELRERVFEPFFTTKPVGQGTGLGLDISYRIVVGRHGGDLTVTSRPGDTRFQVRLPLVERPAD
jgi:signal transduction histidine kinase